MEGKTAVEMLEKKNIHQTSSYPLLLMFALSKRELDGVPISGRVAYMLAATPNFRENQEMSFGQLVVHRKKTRLQVLKTNTPTWFFRSTEGLITTTVQFMADKGMAVIKGKLPKPNLSANDDPDRPRRITPFRWVTKAEPAAGVSMRMPKRKVRPSEHTRTDAGNRLQERINTLTTANERIKAQSLVTESVLRDRNTTIMKKVVDEERKKNKAEIKRISKELKDMKKLYRAESNSHHPQTPKSTPAHGRILSDFAETRSMAEATQESVCTLSAKMSGVESILAKLTEVTAQALKKSKDTDEVTEIQRQKAEDARRDRAWRSYGCKFKTLKSLKVKDIRAMLDMRDAYLDVYNGEKEPNLWIYVDPELKQSLSSSGVTKEGLVDYLRRYMSEHEAYEGEDTLRTIAEKVTWPSEGPFLERLNAYMSSARGCIKWKQLRENAEGRLKVKLDAPKSKFGESLNKFKELINSVYEQKMDTTEDVDLTPPEPTNVAPREFEVRRARQRIRRGSRKKRRHSISSDEGSTNRGRYQPRNNQSGYRYRNKRYERSENKQPKMRNSFLALPAPGDDHKRKKRNATRRLNVLVRRAGRRNVTIHHIKSGDRISDAILDSGADESVASLHKHAWMMDSIEDVKEKITMADGTTDLRVTKVGYTDLEMRVDGIWKRDFRRIKFFLVDDKKWKELLVGAPTLEKAGGPACLKVCKSCFADSAAVVRALMSEELGQLSGVYDMVVVEVNLNLILGSILNFAKYGYTLAETVKILDEDVEGNLAAKSYFVFTKNDNTQKLNRQKSKDVKFLTGLRLPKLRLAAIIRKLTGGKMEVLSDAPAIRAAYIDFSRRLRDGNAEGIPFGETIHLKQNKDVVDEDNLEKLMLPEGNALYKPETEKAEIR
eukprot:augustus_masked-scaffold_5-processed-gene-9.48-mRNA-1 protein AED:1.00 eAED:1.00 QI:0/0/0/0/1/1/5/0/887